MAAPFAGLTLQAHGLLMHAKHAGVLVWLQPIGSAHCTVLYTLPLPADRRLLCLTLSECCHALSSTHCLYLSLVAAAAAS